MKTNKNGISLIVLVVTIIVLAILAATVIIAIVNTGVINSAKDAVEAQKLGQVRDIAVTAWGEALIDPNVSTSGEYLNHIIGFLKGEGYTDEELDKYTIVANVNGVTVNLKDTDVDNPDVTPDEPEVNPDTPEVDPDEPEVDPDTPEVDPDEPEVNPDGPGDTEYTVDTITKDTPGVTFTKADGVTPGDPDNLEAGDIVTYGDYKYRYNMRPNATGLPLSSWSVDNELNGWHVVRRNVNLVSASELCGTIYGKPLVSMQDTFCRCEKLVSAPAIPSSVTNMISTFLDCTSLVEAPDMSRATSVTSMKSTFEGCTNLTEAPIIPEGVTNINRTFYNCTSLTKAPVIPSSVPDMSSTFYGCKSLTGQVQINSSKVSIVFLCFYNISNPLTVKVPVSSTTYDKITSAYGSSTNITIETFEPET